MTAATVLRYELQDLRRSRWVFGYALLLLALTDALLRFGGGGPRALVSLLNVALVLVPLVSVVFGTMYLYGARDFIELLLAQPVRRLVLFTGLYGGLAVPLALALVLGVGLPVVWGGQGDGSVGRPLAMLLGTGVLLTLAFTAIAFLVSLMFEDRTRGFGVALLLWLAATALYDAGVVFVAMAWSDYPLELPLLGLTLLNPIDLGRVLLLRQFDNAALLGYSGAVFERFFGSAAGVAVSAAALVGWCGIPLWVAGRRFGRKDF
jgi:Cu-processing system permease protein